MNDIAEVVTAKINELSKSGFIQDILERKVEESISEALKDAFSSYGAFTKALKENVSSSLETTHYNIDLETYNTMICRIANNCITQHLEKEAKHAIDAAFLGLMKPAPETITMQELVSIVAEAYRDDYYDNDRDDHLSVRFKKDLDYGWFELKFWKQKTGRYSANAPDIELHINKEGEIVWLKDGDRDYGSHNYSVEQLLYRMTIKRTKITDICDCDQDDFEDTYIGIGEDY